MHENAINMASEYGHVDVLEWFKNSGFEFRYSELAIKWASEKGHTNILEWFQKNKFPLYK